MKLRIVLAQINVIVGAFSSNLKHIINAANQAYDTGAHIILIPELALSGYPPEDLLLSPNFQIQCEKYLCTLHTYLLTHLNGLCVVVGHPYYMMANNFTKINSKYSHFDNINIFNAASVFVSGKLIARYFKQELVNSSVFDEKRYFTSSKTPCVFTLYGINFGLLICEDIWHYNTVTITQNAGAQVLLVINASPYHFTKHKMRKEIISKHVIKTGMPIVYLNMVGGQDELIFDGSSFVMDQKCRIVTQFPQFKEYIGYVEFTGKIPEFGLVTELLTDEAEIYQALMLGLNDYIKKNKFTNVVIGLSGGIDSALVLAIACDTLGSKNVHAIMMPSRYTSDISIIDAQNMCSRIGVRYTSISIESIFKIFCSTLSSTFVGLAEDNTEENLQARIRNILLMALSNKFNSLVLNTSNKSEIAVGYCTLYGDMAGGFSVIKDVTKTMVYQLCNYRNNANNFSNGNNIIPSRILQRKPSAELRYNQNDQDTLPPYKMLDEIIHFYIEENKSISDIINIGFDATDVHHIISLIESNEYKRHQLPIGTRITSRAFGRDRRYPITFFYEKEE